MFADIANQIFSIAQGVLVPIPLNNTLSIVYVVLDLLSKIFLLGNSPDGGFGDVLPF